MELDVMKHTSPMLSHFSSWAIFIEQYEPFRVDLSLNQPLGNTSAFKAESKLAQEVGSI